MSVPAPIAARAAELTEVGGVPAIAHFGDPAAEYEAAHRGAALVHRSWRSLVRFSGDDRARFLQGMLSNDIARLQPGAGCRALFLDVKGHVRADLDVWAEADAIVVGSDSGFAEGMLPDLRRYVLGASVVIDDRRGNDAVLGIVGPRAEEVAERAGLALPEAGRWTCRAAELADVAVRVARTPSLAAPGVELHLPAAALDAAWELLEDAAGDIPLAGIGWQAAEAMRVEAGWPRLDCEITGDEFPQEALLDEAVDYEKGCYLGQETVARIHYRGQVNRVLCGLRLAAPAEPGAVLRAGEHEVGRITSFAASPRRGPIGLAYVRREEAEAGASLEVGGDTDVERSARVVALPFEG